MSLFKWLSLASPIVQGPLLAGLVLAVAGDGYIPFGTAGAVSLAVLLGFVPGVLLYVLAERHEQRVNRLWRRIEQVQDAEQQQPLRNRYDLSHLYQAEDAVLRHLQTEIQRIQGKRRELEVQLRVCEGERRHLTAILNAISDAVIVTDAFNEVALANEAAAQVMGFDLNRARHKPIDEVVSDPTLVKLIKDTREGDDPSLRRHLEHEMGSDGDAGIYDVTLACVPAESGHHGRSDRQEQDGKRKNGCGGIVAVLRDITREKEIAEMKSDFVSNVSHELRTPLSSIKAYMEMLVDGEAQDEDTRKQFYNIIQGETNRLSRLIDNILSISRIETGVVKLHREAFALQHLLADVIDIMQPQAQAKQIELVDQDFPVYCEVHADRDMVMQAVLNLIGNAIKYTPEGGQVRLSLERDDQAGMAVVGVSDTGKGIPDDALPHLFDKFYRVADHKKMAKGTGLGLNLVKHVVETVHGGEVGVTSELNKGSTFMFTLPLADNEEG
jgi:two-component system phosphate regulon sensor histidine kinase PhoR